MWNLIPHFIHNKYKENIFRGNFNAITMFADISGFTAMTERLVQYGKEGAEILSTILNRIFSPSIESIYTKGGFISTFAGDAFTAIYPISEQSFIIPTKDSTPFETYNPNLPPDNIMAILSLLSAFSIQKVFDTSGLQKTRLGDFELSVKIGLSYGNVDWGIIGKKETDEDKSKQTKTHLSYFFGGEAINNCAYSEHHCNKGELVIDEKLYSILPKEKLKTYRIDNNYIRIEKESFEQIEESSFFYPLLNVQTTSVPDITKEIAVKFLPEVILEYSYAGEFRDVVSVFISFKEWDTFEDLDNFVGSTINKADNFGGYLEMLDFGDKGGTMLYLFGIPLSFENDIERAVNFAKSVKDDFKDRVRIGITFGSVYAGIEGSQKRCCYGALGDIINLSARFMMNADWGEIWISDVVEKNVRDKYEVKNRGTKLFKGKSEPIQVYELLEQKKISERRFYQGEMVGRNYELDKIREYCKASLDNKFGGVIYIYGEAGIGKSRLLYELAETLKSDFDICLMETDSILKKSMNPIVYYLNNYFKQADANTIEEKKVRFETVLEDLVDKLKNVSNNHNVESISKELIRMKSIIGALLNIYWDNSLYEQLDAKGRFENTLFAIKEFFKSKSLIKPTIILLEDIQWIDDDSKKVFETLTRNIDDFPITILVSSRFYDDGSKPKLLIDDDVPQNEIVLKELSSESVAKLIENQLKYPANNELLTFIISKTEGNPFYVEQFCLYLLDSKSIELEEISVSPSELSETKHSTNKLLHYKLKEIREEIPTGINAILVSRIDRLSSELKEIMQIASILGKEFEVKILSELVKILTSISEKETEKGVIATKLKDKKIKPLLYEGESEQMWSILSEIKCIFKQSLLRDVIYEMQLKERLRNLHRIAAEAIEKIYKNDAMHYSDLAYHYEKAEILDKAKEYLRKAGDYAKSKYQNEQAISIYDRLLKYVDNKNEEIEIYNNKGKVLELIGKWDSAESMYSKALELASNLNEEKLIADSTSNLGNLSCLKGDYSTGLSLFENALQLYTKLNDRPNISKSMGNIGSAYLYQGNYPKAMEYLEQQLNIAVELNDKQNISLAEGNMGIIYMYQGNFPEAMKCYEKQLKIAEELEDKRGMSKVIGNIGVIYMYQGNYSKSIEYFQKQLSMAEELGDKQSISRAVFNIGSIYKNLGELQKSMECFQKQLEISQELGDKQSISRAVGGIGVIYETQGDYQKAMECYQKQLNIANELGDKQSAILALENIGLVYRYQGDYSKAMEYYQKELSIAEELDDKQSIGYAVEGMGKIYIEQGNYPKAMECYKRQLSIAEELGDKQAISSSIGDIGKIYLYQGDYQSAKEYLERQLKISEELGDKQTIGKAIGNIGVIYMYQGDYSKAMECYERQLSISEELGDKQTMSKAISNIGAMYIYRNDYSKAMEYYLKQLSISEELGDKQGINLAIGNIGYIYMSRGDYSKAMEYYQKQLNIAEELGDKRSIIKATNNMGAIYSTQGNYAKAMECFQKQLSISKELDDKQSINRAVINIGVIYNYQGNSSKAMECYQQSLSIAEEMNDKQNIILALENIGAIYLNQKDYSKAMECYQRELNLAQELDDKQSICYAMEGIGKVYLYQNDYSKAMELFQKQLNIAEELDDKQGIGNAHCNIGILYKNREEYLKSIEHLEKWLSIAEELGDKDDIADAMNNLGNVYYNLNDYAKAEEYYDKAISIARDLQLNQCLCKYLQDKANLYFKINKINEAEALKNESLELAKQQQITI